MIRAGIATISLVLLSACAQDQPARVVSVPARPLPPPTTTPASPEFPADGLWQCVPYARFVSGIELYGDAWTWWNQASGKYPRKQEPARGAVLVFAKDGKLKYGHLAVIVAVKGPREVQATDANWGGEPQARGHIHDDQFIQDVSADNSWRQVKVWNPRAKAWGSTYQAYGFVHPAKAWGPPRCVTANGEVGPCPNA